MIQKAVNGLVKKLQKHVQRTRHAEQKQLLGGVIKTMCLNGSMATTTNFNLFILRK